MRSHSFGLISAALLATSGLVVSACDAERVGGFEDDGTGGAGGGLESVASSSTGDDGSTTSQSSSGTGGSPAADAAHITVIQLPDDVHGVDGAFHRGPTSTGLECDEVMAVGPCKLHVCNDTELEAQALIDAGTMLVTGTTEPFTILPADDNRYSAVAQGRIFGSSPSIGVSLTGSNQVPAFSMSVARPLSVTNAAAALAAAADPDGSDLTITWEPEATAGEREINFGRDAADGINFVSCAVEDGTTGSLTIPGELLTASATRAATSLHLNVTSSSLETIGAFDVRLLAADSSAVVSLGGGTICGGLTENGSPVCADDEYCDFPDDICGADDGTGICQPRPQACPFDVVDPVCSCDGEVYQSECFANLAGVDVSALDASCGSGGICGGKSGLVCADDEVCEFENGVCGEADGTGVCKPRPTTCPSDGPVVCACDGTSYPNACEAAAHGVDTWDGEGFCPEPVACGGIGGLTCAGDEFCDYPGILCGGDDGLGVCRPRPTSCPEPNADEAVCGCDFGSTFGSECLANQAGQDITGGDGLECGGA